MLTSEGGKESWEKLRACPISISYEWDPCDSFKVRELLILERDGEYVKSKGEDEMSMAVGLSEFKGRVNLHFCNPISWAEEEGERTERLIASKVDKAICLGYKVFPNQILSAHRLGIEIPSSFKTTSNDKREFEERLEKVVSFIGGEFSKEEIENKWCEITAQPLLAHLAAKA